MKLPTNGIMTILVSLGSILGMAFGAYFYIETNYAKAAEVAQVEQRLDYKIKSDQSKEIQQRIWQLDDRYEKKAMPEAVKEEYRRIEEEKKQLDDEIKSLRQRRKE
jgi:hypothetical protein